MKNILFFIGGSIILLAFVIFVGQFFYEQYLVYCDKISRVQSTISTMESILKDVNKNNVNKIKSSFVKDAWGNEIALKEEGEIVKTISLISKGPDGIFDTKDDLSATRSDIDFTKTGEVVGNTTGKIIIGAGKGMYKSFKDSIFGESDDQNRTKN